MFQVSARAKGLRCRSPARQHECAACGRIQAEWRAGRRRRPAAELITGELITGGRTTYPEALEADIALRDGSIAHIRPIRTADEPRLLAFLRELSDDDRRMRFFSMGNDLSRAAHDEADVDYVNSLGLLATVGSPERLVGHALYAPAGDGRAEVAFAIAAEYQGQGLATMLLGQLADAAAAQGVVTFEAIVLMENRRMLNVLRASGFPVKTTFDSGNVVATFPTSLTPQGLARFEQREELASASALRRVLYPRAVAVVGDCLDPAAEGAAVVRNLRAAGFPGPIHPLDPAAGRLEDIPVGVDLAVIAVPTPLVLGVAEQCGRQGVRSLIVLTAGFAEVGADGQRRQSELLRICRAYGMRLIGPNCIGVVNTDPAAPLNATFGPIMPPPGQIGLATQGGALGLAAIDFTTARELGFSSLVSMGNKADISGNDLLGFWHTDPRTDVILLYLESFGNPRKFARLARVIGRAKPIVALRSAADTRVDALFHQAGVVRTDTLDEMLDVADLLVHQPLPAGPRVAIVTNAGGPAAMCANTCVARGLELPPLSEATQARLRQLLPAETVIANPVDMLAAATAEHYAQSIQVIAEDPNVDALIAIFLTPLAILPEAVARAVADAVDGLSTPKPVVAVFMSSRPLPRMLGGGRIPGYHTPEPAAIALSHAVRYAAWRARPEEEPPTLAEVDRDEAGVLLGRAVQRGSGWLAAGETQRLLGLYGVRVAVPEKAGVEMVVGVLNDPHFGPTITCGAGGALAELLNDVAVRLTPLARRDAAGMLRELRSFPLLDGHRGAPRCDVGALEDVLTRISALAEDHPSIAEMECNPVVVGVSGAVVLEARIRVAAVAPRRPLGARR
jgi:acyl-CoA synthetase (NDP forming)/RimJ/RimL family protein N-acetyltransferase